VSVAVILHFMDVHRHFLGAGVQTGREGHFSW